MIISRGFVHLQDQDALFDAARRVVSEALTGGAEQERGDVALLKENVKVALRRFIQKTFDRRPMILPIIVDMEGEPGA